MDSEFVVDFEPLGRRARVVSGVTLLEAARQAGVGLNALCGGAGTCGTCRVRLVGGKASPPTEAERDAVAEGLWNLLQEHLRKHHGVSKVYLPLYVARFEFLHNRRGQTDWSKLTDLL